MIWIWEDMYLWVHTTCLCGWIQFSLKVLVWLSWSLQSCFHENKSALSPAVQGFQPSLSSSEGNLCCLQSLVWDGQQGSQMCQINMMIYLERKRAPLKRLNLTVTPLPTTVMSVYTPQACNAHNSCLIFLPCATFLAPIPKSRSLTIPKHRGKRGRGKGKAWGRQVRVATGHLWHICPDSPGQCPAAKGAAEMECDLLFPTLALASRVQGWAEDVGTETGNPVEIAGKKPSH